MQAVILLAGYGARLKRDDLPHKSLLPFGNETLLSRHLKCLETLPVTRAFLVVGHNKEAVKDYVRGLGLSLPVEFVDNEVFLTTGNTLSMVMGLRLCTDDVLILDGDVLYPFDVLRRYSAQSAPSSFAVVPVDIDDHECAKVLLDRNTGAIRHFITKRALTAEEKSAYDFGGEAIGFFKLSRQAAEKFIRHYENNEPRYRELLWEIPFSEFSGQEALFPWHIRDAGCFEIDSPEDYREALDWFDSHPSSPAR